MMCLSRPEKRTFFMCLILWCLTSLFFVPSAKAETASGERVDSLGQAVEKANTYSFDTGGIGIIMSYGTKNGVTAEDIGDAFVNEFKRRGENARYFFYHTQRDGMALSFRIGYSALGPWDADTAASHASEIVERAKAARRVHNQ